jgi:pimeloyl-ACP methyl ester carboxylesterase
LRDSLRDYWASNSPSARKALRSALLTFEATKFQYVHGTPEAKADSIDPATYHLGYALLEREGNKGIQLDLFRDYQSNVKMYPQFRRWLRESGVPVLVVWGRNDPCFGPGGAEAYRRDAKDAEVHLLDAGHFALETETGVILEYMLEFLGRVINEEA